MYTISVCIATYNGESYLSQQIDSILSQSIYTNSYEGLEVLISDDNSSDSTIDLIDAYIIRFPFVSLYHNEVRLGPLKNFSKVLSKASGDLIVLCDQDDVWKPNKLQYMLLSYQTHKAGPFLFIHDAQIIDASNSLISASYFGSRNPFRKSIFANFVTNRYLGCAMTVNKELLNICLPIPSFAPQHDIWIGINSSLFSFVDYLNSPLSSYRSHSTNASPASQFKSGSLSQIVSRRLSFLLCIVAAVLKRLITFFLDLKNQATSS